MKSHLTISVDEGLVEWLDKRIEDSTYRNRSHAVESIINRYIKGIIR